MNSYLPLLLAFVLLLPTNAHAEEASAATALTAESRALRLELESVNAQHETAMNLHIASTVFAVAGAGGIAVGLAASVIGVTSGLELVAGLVGASLTFVHVVLTVIGASLDFGSASHRRKLLEAHPELSIELTPGPGEAGLGFAVHF